MHIRTLFVLTALGALLSGCPCLQPRLHVGMVANMPIESSAFNATAWHGCELARETLNITAELYINEDFSAYGPGIDYFLEERCDMIFSVGFYGAEATQAAAAAHPDVHFVCLDNAYAGASGLPNLAGATFDTHQAAFLAGYLAAGMTQTGIVGVMGGMDIPPVKAFMQGMADGAAHYNAQYNAAVQVVGMDLFLNSFDDAAIARQAAEQQLAAGADILMAATGDGALGVAEAVLNAPGALYIGVDVDWYLSHPEFGSVTLTSIMKHLDVAVLDLIAAVRDGSFDGTDYVGVLANNGVGLAPFHELDAAVPEQLKLDLSALSSHFEGR